MFCSRCGYQTTEAVDFCPNCGMKLVQNASLQSKKANKGPSKSKKKIIIAVVSVFLVFSLIVAAVVSVGIIQLFSYRCADCNKFVVFEEHIIMSDDGEYGRWVCNQCHNAWMSEEYGITFSGERVDS